MWPSKHSLVHDVSGLYYSSASDLILELREVVLPLSNFFSQFILSSQLLFHCELYVACNKCRSCAGATNNTQCY